VDMTSADRDEVAEDELDEDDEDEQEEDERAGHARRRVPLRDAGGGTKKPGEITGPGQLLPGPSPGRSDPAQITVFASNAGMGLQFAVAGALALRWCE